MNAFIQNVVEIKYEEEAAAVVQTPTKAEVHQQQHPHTVEHKQQPSATTAEATKSVKKQLFTLSIAQQQQHQNQQPDQPAKSAHVDQTASSSISNQPLTGNYLATIKRPTNIKELFNTNQSTIQQQYRIASSIVKGTPSTKTAKCDRKQSFAKFLERNTPSKLTRTELEEKRKVDLLYKEKKEQERLQELERMQQEKIENQKKKREEKMKKINEIKIKQQEDDAKRREELDAKLKEVEENKRRLLEEKRKEEQEKQRIREQRIQAAATAGVPGYHAIQVPNSNDVLASAQKKTLYHNVVPSSELKHHHSNQVHQTKTQVTTTSFYSSTNQAVAAAAASSTTTMTSSSTTQSKVGGDNYDNLSTFKIITAQQQQQLQQLMNKPKLVVTAAAPSSTTAPPGSTFKPNAGFLKPLDTNQVKQEPAAGELRMTPTKNLLEMKKYNPENYDIHNLKSDDETDDDEDPRKPIPSWAKEPNLSSAARAQSFKFINYTKLFKAACQNEIILDNIFKFKRKKFNERSSSANWSSPPVWRTNGICGEESFRQLQKSTD